MQFELETLKELYKIGRGPSSSHTIGPFRAMQWYIKQFPETVKVKVTLFGSLSITGRGHMTDLSIQEAIGNMPLELVWDYHTKTEHPNTMDVRGYDIHGNKLEKVRVISQGGGSYTVIGYDVNSKNLVYPHKTFAGIKEWCIENKKSLVDYVKHYDPHGYDFLSEVWKAMEKSVKDGLNGEGLFNGPVRLSKLTKMILKNLKERNYPKDSVYYAMAYAYSVSEINVQHGIVVTAPTLGSAGVLPGLLYYCKHNLGYKDSQIIDMLAVAGIIGILFVRNGSVAGATGGCQAECGCACAMAAAGFAYAKGGNNAVIEAAAIIAEEHHLGLTCDAILGHVYSPCIERNGVMALRAISSAEQALITDGIQEIFNIDDIIKVELRTGKDMNPEYRETGLGGLSYCWKIKNNHPLDTND